MTNEQMTQLLQTRIKVLEADKAKLREACQAFFDRYTSGSPVDTSYVAGLMSSALQETGQ